ncbi:STAS domain-containing protein [Gemmobacter serpentinus]|uniref:STAS domain-containing protein n=1 Tax=Gemmobacter serpentinus TaxID=2652247 RepID=UPI00124F45D8|nr:STAS domain-containing protein [Gemmobacter serpentinus]
MDLEAIPTPDLLLVRVLSERIDAAGAIQFKDRMRELSAPPGGVDGNAARIPVLLDMSRVGFLDSSGLGAVVAVMKLLAPRRLELAALTPTVEKVFRLTRMDSVFTIHPDLPEPLRHVG